MPNDITFRLARRDASDARAFCALSNSLYARKVDERYFDWQFFDCPHAPLLMTGWSDDRMVAAYGVHVVTSVATPRAMSLDIMIAEDHQGQGLIATLAAAALDEARRRGAQRLAVVGNPRARDAMGRRLGWTTWKTLADWTRATAASGAAPARPVERPPAARFAPGPDTFYPRDDATLDWRTRRGPRYRYSWLEAGPIDRPHGWSVVKLFRDPVTGEGFGDVLGVFPALDEVAPAGSLLQATLAWFASEGVGAAAFYPTSPDERDAMHDLGFVRSQRERFFCGQGADLNVEVGMLDVDVY